MGVGDSVGWVWVTVGWAECRLSWVWVTLGVAGLDVVFIDMMCGGMARRRRAGKEEEIGVWV
ncbi:hypothetical protein Hamer_G012433 [Homarus americanus]|uniref:Transmembrane protein n=1 Tax=Homarus americanus TaxID=6706 RepID=A0A8J5N1C0_HOMAM|nr:hypothetical protein Hamer_G012433 [Homarus americanus]